MQKVRSLHIAGLFLLTFAGITSCARNLYYLDVVADGAPVITDNAEEETTEITFSADLYKTDTESVAAVTGNQSFSVELYISLKYTASSEPDTINNKSTERVEIGEESEPELLFSYVSPTAEMQPGEYWLEFVWMDDDGYHIVESQAAAYGG